MKVHRRSVAFLAAALFSGLLLTNPNPASASNGNAGLHVKKTVDSTTISPSLALSLTVDKPTAFPGDSVTYTAQLQNKGAAVSIAGSFSAEATASTTATIVYYWDEIDTCLKGCGNGDGNPNWTPFAAHVNGQTGYQPVEPPGVSTGINLSVSGQPVSGVTYPSSGDAVLGTSIQPKAIAVWKYQASLDLTPAQTATLSDPTKVATVRNVIHFEVTPREANAAQPFDDREVFTNPLQAAPNAASLTAITITFTLPDGSQAMVDQSQTPALASLNPGASASATTTYKVPTVAQKRSGETDAAYFARLAGVDGSLLAASASASGTAYGGVTDSASSNSVSTTEHLPIVTIIKSGPPQLDAGSTETNPLALKNIGGATATGLAIVDSLPNGASGSVSGLPAKIEPGATATAQASYAVPPSQPGGPLTDTSAVSWQDANGNSYGPVSSSFTTTVNTNQLLGARLRLGPTGPLNDVTGTNQSLMAQLVDRSGKPIANQSISISTTGANSTANGGVTDGSGEFSSGYTGANSGADRAQAVVTSGANKVFSNVVIIGWLTPPPAGATTVVQGNFFPEPSSASSFVAKPGDKAAFSQTFPNINFNPPSGFPPHVWSYMQSAGLVHDPSTYSDLPTYTTTSAGLEVWEPASTQPPLVTYNPTSQAQVPYPGISIPSRKLDVHPGSGNMVIVGWRSPVTDRINVSGGVSSLDSHGASGVAWTIDQGATTLASGRYSGQSGQTFAAGTGGSSLTNLSVSAGDTLYFTFAPNPAYYFDSTELDITISSVAGATWDVARDFHTPGNEVDPYSTPFTDVTTDRSGKPTGTIPAQGNGSRAGVGAMSSFDANLTGNYLAGSAGDVTFNFYAGDGFIFGVGNGAERVSGSYENIPQPSATPFSGYPVVGGFNQIDPGGPNYYAVTVHFPSPGTYPFEVDFFSAGSDRSLVMAVAQQVKDTTPFSVHVAYADGVRPAGSIFPYPWLGSQNVVFVGCSPNCTYDTGAIRIDNNTTSAQTINSLAVDIGSCHYDIWPKDTNLPAGQIAIFTEMISPNSSTVGCDNTSGTFDTSDVPVTCTPDGIIPEVHLTIDGVAYNYADTTQVLNTGGIDPPSCGRGNESEPWTRIGGVGIPINVPLPPAVSMMLAPAVANNAVVGQTQHLTLSAFDASGQPVSGLSLLVQILGANRQTLQGVTDERGLMALAYTGIASGSDGVQATTFISGFRAASNTATVNWVSPKPPTTAGTAPPSITDLLPSDGAAVTMSIPVTASITVPLGASIASYSVVIQPTGGGQSVTITSGQGTPPTQLGILDPAAFLSGTYFLTASATTTSGATASLSNAIVITPVLPPPPANSTGMHPPSITNLVPGNGAVISVRTPVSATIVPSSGDAITSYSITLESTTGGPTLNISAGTGAPPPQLGVIDPTSIASDTYVMTISIATSGGATAALSNSILVTSSGNPQTSPVPSVTVQPSSLTYQSGQPVILQLAVTNMNPLPCQLSALSQGSVSISQVTINAVPEQPTTGGVEFFAGITSFAGSASATVAPGASINVELDGGVDPLDPTQTFLQTTDMNSAQVDRWATSQPGVYTVTLSYDPSALPSFGASTCQGASLPVTATFAVNASSTAAIPSVSHLVPTDLITGVPPNFTVDPTLVSIFQECTAFYSSNPLFTDPAGVYSDLTTSYPNYPVAILLLNKSFWITPPVIVDGIVVDPGKRSSPPGQVVDGLAHGNGATSAEVYWDPTFAKTVDGVSAPPCVVLYHELAHVRDDLVATLAGVQNVLGQICTIGSLNMNIFVGEWRAVLAENSYRAYATGDFRPSYEGKPVFPDYQCDQYP